mmetsp:Transcript_23092/g.75157  ORF Transcript_23092/g.75157 Transcript_23092/m.75157 type:complete len:249 (+) Transcript_23092:3458-4204(+)
MRAHLGDAPGPHVARDVLRVPVAEDLHGLQEPLVLLLRPEPRAALPLRPLGALELLPLPAGIALHAQGTGRGHSGEALHIEGGRVGAVSVGEGRQIDPSWQSVARPRAELILLGRLMRLLSQEVPDVQLPRGCELGSQRGSHPHVNRGHRVPLPPAPIALLCERPPVCRRHAHIPCRPSLPIASLQLSEGCMRRAELERKLLHFGTRVLQLHLESRIFSAQLHRHPMEDSIYFLSAALVPEVTSFSPS